jgi:hypothetical protein
LLLPNLLNRHHTHQPTRILASKKPPDLEGFFDCNQEAIAYANSALARFTTLSTV